MQVRKAMLLHVGSAITGKDSDFFIWHSQRNRIWVMAKNIPSPLVWLVLALQLAVVPLVLLRRGRAKWAMAFKGMVAGVRALPRAWQSRRKVQSERILSNGEVAHLLVWDLRKVLRHAPHFLDAAAQAAIDSR